MPWPLAACARLRSIRPASETRTWLPEVNDYSTPSVAERMAAALAASGVTDCTLVGHDVGAWIAFAWASTAPKSVSRLVLLDAAIPGAFPENLFTVENAARTFQFFSMRPRTCPNDSRPGRERVYLDWVFTSKTRVEGAIRPADVDVYMRGYGQPERMRAGFNYYRAVTRSVALLHDAPPLVMPVLALGAEHGIGDGMTRALTARCSNLRGEVVPGSGHFIPEEAPAFLTEKILSFVGEESRS